MAHDGQSVKNDVSAPLGAIRPTPPAPGPTRRALRRALSSGHAHGPHLTPARGLDPVLQTVSIASAPMPPSVSVEGIRNVDFVLPPDTKPGFSISSRPVIACACVSTTRSESKTALGSFW